jgi:hypothetical protein
MGTVLLAISESGLLAARNVACSGTAVWCDCRALSNEQFAKLEPGTVTRFTHAIDGDEAMADALFTIAQHHPGDVVFVERPVEAT